MALLMDITHLFNKCFYIFLIVLKLIDVQIVLSFTKHPAVWWYDVWTWRSCDTVVCPVSCVPISPIVANLFMEKFEVKAINSTHNQPRLLLRYVHDTVVIQKTEYSHQFLQQINSTDPHIQFTAETPCTAGSIPFLTP